MGRNASYNQVILVIQRNLWIVEPMFREMDGMSYLGFSTWKSTSQNIGGEYSAKYSDFWVCFLKLWTAQNLVLS